MWQGVLMLPAARCAHLWMPRGWLDSWMKGWNHESGEEGGGG